MAAAHAGLRVDDEILAIDGKPVKPMTPEDVHRALLGKVGSIVTLNVRRQDGAVLDVRVERGPLAGSRSPDE